MNLFIATCYMDDMQREQNLNLYFLSKYRGFCTCVAEVLFNTRIFCYAVHF